MYKMTLYACILALSSGWVFGEAAAASDWVMRSPSGERYVERNESGETVLPNGRLVPPVPTFEFFKTGVAINQTELNLRNSKPRRGERPRPNRLDPNI